MTGRRKRRGKPLKSIAVVQRSHDDFQRRLAQARSAAHQASVAMNYLMAAWCRSGTAEHVKSSAEEMVRVLVAEAHRIDSATVAEFQRSKKEAW